MTEEEAAAEEVASLEAERKLMQLARLIKLNMSSAVEAIGSSRVQDIFKRADQNGDGVLSIDEGTQLIRELQGACGAEVDTPQAAQALLEQIDIDGNGCVSFVEFLIAFGLSDGARSSRAVSFAAEEAAEGAAATAGSPTSAGGGEQQQQDDGGIASDLIQGVCQQIITALYERLHGLQRAFAHLDTKGDGWLGEDDFELALKMVIELVAPRGHDQGDTSSPSASPTSLHKEASSKGSFRVEPIESIDVTCVSELVKSLEGSTLTDGKTPMKIDYCAFVQAFGIVDTAEDALWLG